VSYPPAVRVIQALRVATLVGASAVWAEAPRPLVSSYPRTTT